MFDCDVMVSDVLGSSIGSSGEEVPVGTTNRCDFVGVAEAKGRSHLLMGELIMRNGQPEAEAEAEAVAVGDDHLVW